MASTKLTFIFTFVYTDKKSPWGEVIGTFSSGKALKAAVKEWLVKNDASEGEIIKAIHELTKTKGHTPFYGPSALSVWKTPLDVYPLDLVPGRKTSPKKGIKSPLSSNLHKSILEMEKKEKEKGKKATGKKASPKASPKKKVAKKASPKSSPKNTKVCGCALSSGKKCSRAVKEGTKRCWQHQGCKA